MTKDKNSPNPAVADADASSSNQTSPSDLIAAIDLGSNSFHMVIGQVMHNEVRILEKRGEKVQLAAGLDEKNRLDEASQERGLACLQRFAERLQGMPGNAVLAVGTNALRVAKNSAEFLRKADKILDHRISIISGREEARLIYLGVAHSLADDDENRLVIDIGGGSTEFIIGRRFETCELESLHMGCVSYRDRYFSNGKITSKAMRAAIVEASRELLSLRKRYRKVGWAHCVGSSGSIKAIRQACQTIGASTDSITREDLAQLQEIVENKRSINHLSDLGVRKDRQSIFPSGLAILIAAFDTLNIEQMDFCDGALREGLLYDMLGRNRHEDVRERTITSLQERYFVDKEHAEAVAATAELLWSQVAIAAPVAEDDNGLLLRWAAQLHEIGLAISHSQFHKHGAYLAHYSDLAGFSRQTQQALAVLIRFHRRKITESVFQEACPDEQETMLRLTVVLRLAVLLQHMRNGDVPADVELAVHKNTFQLVMPSGWLSDRTLIHADLDAEKSYLDKMGIELTYSESNP